MGHRFHWTLARFYYKAVWAVKQKRSVCTFSESFRAFLGDFPTRLLSNTLVSDNYSELISKTSIRNPLPFKQVQCRFRAVCILCLK